jgi:hypothetical protein
MRLGIAAIMLCFGANIGAAATFPTDQVPSSKIDVAADWNSIQNIFFDCEGGASLVVSHKARSVSRNGLFLSKLLRSDAVYKSTNGHSFAKKILISVATLSGSNWLLEEYGPRGEWLFYDHGVFETCWLKQ